jgi:hypothetical protein
MAIRGFAVARVPNVGSRVPRWYLRPMSIKHPDRLAAITSGFVGALALGLSVYNVVLQRQQIRAQVWPYLEWNYDNGEGFAYQLHNAGVGPALIKAAQVTIDGKAVASWDEALAQLGVGDKHLQGRTINVDFNGRVIGTGVLLKPFEIQALKHGDEEQEAAISGAMTPLDSRIQVQICYCSTLDECWLMRSKAGTKPVSNCPVFAKPFGIY